ncbi:hypothetical protein HGM15179_016272 [Zosterops borbonicus]|uniref:Uncharacterized protein n=1 Tax=Zosterops borbonicus TaxID=364589 RepID=A0A8K1G3G6_9PASS|nr:hypothetical protein HGM15179_016272 [Zosterops borbonicus]
MKLCSNRSGTRGTQRQTAAVEERQETSHSRVKLSVSEEITNLRRGTKAAMEDSATSAVGGTASGNSFLVVNCLRLLTARQLQKQPGATFLLTLGRNSKMLKGADDSVMEQEDSASQHGEMTSWDINDIKLPQGNAVQTAMDHCDSFPAEAMVVTQLPTSGGMKAGSYFSSAVIHCQHPLSGANLLLVAAGDYIYTALINVETFVKASPEILGIAACLMKGIPVTFAAKAALPSIVITSIHTQFVF